MCDTVLGGWAALQTVEGAPAFPLIYSVSAAGNYTSSFNCVNHTMEKQYLWVDSVNMVHWPFGILQNNLDFSCTSDPLYIHLVPALADLWLSEWPVSLGHLCWAASEPGLEISVNDQLFDSCDMCLWPADRYYFEIAILLFLHKRCTVILFYITMLLFMSW